MRVAAQFLEAHPNISALLGGLWLGGWLLWGTVTMAAIVTLPIFIGCWRADRRMEERP